MTQFEYVLPHSHNRMIRLADARRIANSLRRGSLAVLPTETGYMLAALATSAMAIQRAFYVKERNPSNVMHVACDSLRMAESAGILTSSARRLLGHLTPGPVTVIVEKTNLLPNRLVTLNGTVGIRIPDYPATLQVIGEVGAPLTATSLNVSGSEPTPIDQFEFDTMNWPPRETVYVVQDDEAIAHKLPSTLVRVTRGYVEILREGPVSESEIQRVTRLGSDVEALDPI